jgi:hypothetical protein
MLPFETQVLKGMRAAIEAFGTSVTINGTVYDCVQADASQAALLLPGRLFDDNNFMLSVVKEDFATVPAVGTIATFNGKNVRILEVQTSEEDAEIRLIVGGTNK